MIDTGKQHSNDKQNVVLFVYGAGGHKTEMKRLAARLQATAIDGQFNYITLGDGAISSDALAHFDSVDIRDKHSRLTSLLHIIPIMFGLIRNLIRIHRQYNIVGVVSTGPGIALLPFLFYRFRGVKTVFLETFCRFETKSYTGRLIYFLSDRFLVQNKELLRLYPNAEYCGRL